MMDYSALGEGKDKGLDPKIHIVVLTFVSVVFVIAFAVTHVQYTALKSQKTADQYYSYCEAPPECINTPAEYVQRFTSNDGFSGPDCVSSTLVGRVISFPGNNDTSWMPTATGHTGFGSRISFAISASALEKFLPLGQHDATMILQTLGYGDTYTCGTEVQNYADCQYRLVLWNAPCLTDRPPVTEGYWDNLEWFLQTYVYGELTPDLETAIAEIKAQHGLLKGITGCDNLILTPNNYWNATVQAAAGCSEEFISASQYFARTKCNGTNKASTQYVPDAGCVAENRFLAEKNISSVRLRAYLMQNEGFNPYYTGYGYTANQNFNQALEEEFWYPNTDINDLPEVIVIKFYNGTQGM